MSYTVNEQASRQPVRSDGYSAYDTDEGLGWLFFAATMLGIAGIMRIMDAIWAFHYHGALPDGLRDGTFGSDLKNYAWIWLGVGVVLIASSFLVMVRSQFARFVGFFAAAIAAITAVTWMPYYPIWALLYIGLAVLVFYALAAHGGRPA
ncbi:MAG TPA: hypothetical protein VGO03_21340 [Acidimicrobiia bacterium]|jgi:hypothetical protein